MASLFPLSSQTLRFAARQQGRDSLRHEPHRFLVARGFGKTGECGMADGSDNVTRLSGVLQTLTLGIDIGAVRDTAEDEG